jgi:hypothetical protein
MSKVSGFSFNVGTNSARVNPEIRVLSLEASLNFADTRNSAGQTGTYTVNTNTHKTHTANSNSSHPDSNILVAKTNIHDCII